MTGFRGSTAVVGVGATDYFKRGTSPLSSAQLVLQAILAACDDAGADPRSIDGFVSYAGDSSEGLAIGAALGVHEVRWSTQVWGGGGGAVAAAVNAAAAAVFSGQADCVAVYRGLSEASDGRGAFNKGHMGHLYAAHGVLAPAQVCALRTQRMLEVDGVPASALEAVALAGYHHAQRNPKAVAYGQPLDRDRYQNSRLISEPLHLYDCSRENDGATAYRLTVNEVPVDGFWSVTVYNKDGYFTPNPQNAYSLNNITAQRGADGKITIQFGGCDAATANCLPVTSGWNYLIRFYRPRAEVLDGSWTPPTLTPCTAF